MQQRVFEGGAVWLVVSYVAVPCVCMCFMNLFTILWADFTRQRFLSLQSLHSSKVPDEHANLMWDRSRVRKWMLCSEAQLWTLERDILFSEIGDGLRVRLRFRVRTSVRFRVGNFCIKFPTR